VILVVVAAAFLAGFWPERQRRTELEAENAFLQAQVANLEDRVRLGQLHGELLNVIDAVADMNYGQAQMLSSALFNNIRAEASRTQNPEFRAALDAILALRDQITGALAKGDASALEPLRQSERQLREALGAPSSVAV
jgi:hypothetical protein